jgi:hypothetical protein
MLLQLKRLSSAIGRVRSPSGPSALVALNLKSHRKTGRLGDPTLPIPNRSHSDLALQANGTTKEQSSRNH